VNLNAADRLLSDYNHFAYPTVYFDGGYRVDVASLSVPVAEAKYIESIDSCGHRPAADLDVTVRVSWLGNATMYIEVSVQNNNDSSYHGSLRAYVTEISSTMGWNDTQGNPYSFTFLDYAFDQNIWVGAGSEWQSCTTWNGNDHTDGYGNTFGSITRENTMVIAAVFNPERHLAYAWPPDRFPFDAYYVDQVAPATWINSPPNLPGEPTPENGATKVHIDADLSWSGGDPDAGDTVRYDVYFGTSPSPPLVSSSQSATTHDPGTMMYDSTYYWMIVAWDNHETSRPGPIWSFTADPGWIRGDPNGDGEVGISDVVYLINYMFRDGPAPDPLESGNVNCDPEVGLADVIYLINYLFRNGSPPCE
jgi:hypothetical protein